MAPNQPVEGSRGSAEKDGDVDELLSSLGLDDEGGPEGVEEPNAAKPPRGGSKLWGPLSIALGAAAVLAIGAVAWYINGSSDDSGGTETATGSTVAAGATTEAPPGLEDQADELRAALSRLGLDGVEVETRETGIHVVGTVATEQDRSALRNAVTSSFDPALIDMSEIVVDPAYGQQALPGQPAGGGPPPPPGAPPPGAPPPGFVPPTPEQQQNLQVELNRALTETPLVFDSGSTELNELQLTVLDTVIINLLEAHPGVPVRLVGYTDETGGEYENSLLSFERANAVRDYLVSRGVPEFILRVEGRGEEDLTGDSGADRRVEIEVIEQTFGS